LANEKATLGNFGHEFSGNEPKLKKTKTRPQGSYLSKIQISQQH
jgi:hypothetical protein